MDTWVLPSSQKGVSQTKFHQRPLEVRDSPILYLQGRAPNQYDSTWGVGVLFDGWCGREVQSPQSEGGASSPVQPCLCDAPAQRQRLTGSLQSGVSVSPAMAPRCPREGASQATGWMPVERGPGTLPVLGRSTGVRPVERVWLRCGRIYGLMGLDRSDGGHWPARHVGGWCAGGASLVLLPQVVWVLICTPVVTIIPRVTWRHSKS